MWLIYKIKIYGTRLARGELKIATQEKPALNCAYLVRQVSDSGI
jgi:hypothetical protein